MCFRSGIEHEPPFPTPENSRVMNLKLMRLLEEVFFFSPPEETWGVFSSFGGQSCGKRPGELGVFDGKVLWDKFYHLGTLEQTPC
jgi:hypothetical protein